MNDEPRREDPEWEEQLDARLHAETTEHGYARVLQRDAFQNRPRPMLETQWNVGNPFQK